MDENKELNEAQEDDLPMQQKEDQDQEKKKMTVDQALVEIVGVLASSIIAIMIIFTFVFRIVGVVGPSMEQTLHEGDWLLVSAFNFKHDRGDIVIITQPNRIESIQDEPIVKRIIALGGDELAIDFENATVSVNGKIIRETYLNSPTTDDEGIFPNTEQNRNSSVKKMTIPKGKVFVMGDNRQHSTDSRSPKIGLIDEHYILGQVRLRFSPFDQMKFFSDYDYE